MEFIASARSVVERLDRTPDFAAALANLFFETSPQPLVNVASFLVYVTIGVVATIGILALRR